MNPDHPTMPEPFAGRICVTKLEAHAFSQSITVEEMRERIRRGAA